MIVMANHDFKFGMVFERSGIPEVDTRNGERRFEISKNLVTISDEKGRVIQFCTCEIEQMLREMCDRSVIRARLSIW